VHPLLAALAVVGSDLAGTLAFPPTRVKILSFVFLIPFLLVIRRGPGWAAQGWTWLWAVLGAWGLAHALPTSLATFYLQPLWMGWAISLGIWTVMAALYYMAFTPIYRRLVGRVSVVALPWFVAAAWVAAELTRGRLFTGTEFFVGNPWGLLGYALAGPGPMAQVGEWTGVYGLTFCIVAANAGLAELLVAWRRRGRPERAAWLGAGFGFVPALVIWVHGLLVLHGAPPHGAREGMIEVGVVQGDVSLGSRWRSDFYGRNLDIYLDLTRQLAAAGTPRLIVWPEAAFTFFLEDEPAYQRAIARVLGPTGAELLAGGPSAKMGRAPYLNSVFHLTPEGAIAGRYDKRHLVPFTEFFPWERLDVLEREFEGARTFVHGKPRPLFETVAGRAGMLVCNEAMLPEVAVERVRAGAEVLVNPSNDGWIADAGFAAHMADVVHLRAVEHRRYLIRSSTTGPSAVVDPWGRVRVTTGYGERRILLGLVEPRREWTFYTRAGDAFAFACVGLTVLGLFLSRSRRTADPAGLTHRERLAEEETP